MAAIMVALVAGAGIIVALCLGLANPAGVAASALADILACAAIALAVAGYTVPCAARSRTTDSPLMAGRPVTEQRGARSWELDTLDESDWARWEREVFGPSAPGTSPGQQPGRRRLPPPTGPFHPGDGTTA
jgi:hypothetical protein